MSAHTVSHRWLNIAARTALVASMTAMSWPGSALAAPEPRRAVPESSLAVSSVPVDVRGTVRDSNGNPVRNASVRLMSDSDTLDVATDRSGRFRGRIPTRRGVAMRVRAPGYRDLIRFVQAGARLIGVSLTLPPPYPMSSVTVVACATSLKHVTSG